MNKPEVLRLDLNEREIKNYIDLMKNLKIPFKVAISNYTVRITNKNYDIYFLKNNQSNKVFAAAAKLRADLKDKICPPLESENKYFDTNFKGDVFYSDTVQNLDLKSAYATILNNENFISNETFKYLSNLDKLDRLAAVGMIASKKEIFNYDKKGNLISNETVKNPLSDFFFYCVQKTEFIISDIRQQILQEDFLFSWVDGIYYLNPTASYNKVAELYTRETYGMKLTFKNLSQFEVLKKKNHYNITFLEPKKIKKEFNIPFKDAPIKKQIINYLLTKKY
jgi:hypothetical protein